MVSLTSFRTDSFSASYMSSSFTVLLSTTNIALVILTLKPWFDKSDKTKITDLNMAMITLYYYKNKWIFPTLLYSKEGLNSHFIWPPIFKTVRKFIHKSLVSFRSIFNNLSELSFFSYSETVPAELEESLPLL